ncbi:MAG: hypothetical protein SGJ11_08680 [Phycisphaerae bacterium]|mgnify:CR=1 FL=1|nr:hypothetical protein [Phycisphaerae bacterium]
MIRRSHALIAPLIALLFAAAPLACERAVDSTAAPATAVEATAPGEHGTVQLHAVPSVVEVGLPITLTVDVVRTDGATTLPPVPIQIGDFDVAPLSPPRVENGHVIATYRLTTLASGAVTLPSFSLPLAEGDDAPVIASPELTLQVTSLIGEDDDPANFRDIKSRLDLVPRAARWPWYAGGAAALSVLALAAWLLATRQKRPTRPMTPAAIALAAIDALERESLPATGRVHEFYVRLADVIRAYVEGRFGIRAPELTTQEFLREARRSSAIADTHQMLLARFLRNADMVKFAGAKPDGEECAGSVTIARQFVQESQQISPSVIDAPVAAGGVAT